MYSSMDSADITLSIKLINENAKLPTRGDQFSAGLDVYAPEGNTILPGQRLLVKTGLMVSLTPLYMMDEYYIRIAPRSGLSLKGIDVAAGVVDSSYRGELGVVLVNNSNNEFTFNSGDRIAQMITERISIPKIVQVDNLDETERGDGGFGSTGN